MWNLLYNPDPATLAMEQTRYAYWQANPPLDQSVTGQYMGGNAHVIWDGGSFGESALGFAAAGAAAFSAVTGSYSMGVAAGVLGVAAMGAGAVSDAANSGAVADAYGAAAAYGGL